MKNRYFKCGMLMILSAFCLTACGKAQTDSLSSSENEESSGSETALVSPDETYEKTAETDSGVQDKSSLYTDYSDEDVGVIYLTLGEGNEADDTDHTWYEVNHSETFVSCEAVLQFGDETAPLEGEFGYGDLTANATVRLQGTNASEKQQKSYRISIRDGKGNVDGMKSIVLAKCFSDPLRYKNRLAYDLMQDIPGLLSTRTEFIHLYIKDKTEEGHELFEDYGLYTLVEPINKTYLSARGLAKSAPLYKAVNFDWRPHSDVLKNSTEVGYDALMFDQILEIQGKEDHTNLLKVISAVNDESVPIEDTIVTYFDEDNLYNYMAFCILMGKQDAALEDYYLYNPTGTEKFYLIGWNFSDILSRASDKVLEKQDREPWNVGIFSLTDSYLFERMMKSDECRERLDQAVNELYDTYLTEDKVNAESEKLSAAVRPLLYALPDMTFARVKEEDYDILTQELYDEISENYELFYTSIESPWPFHILEPEAEKGNTTLRWENSYIQSGTVTYRITLDDSWDFTNPIGSYEVKDTEELNVGTLDQGEYFVKIEAVSGDGKIQEAREFYNTEKKTVVNGTLCFYIQNDGSAAACYMEEDD